MSSDGLTFQWFPRRWFCPRLAATLGLSILGHLIAFLLFIIVSSEQVTSPIPAPEISILNQDIPEHRTLLDALQSQSPIGALAHRLLPVGNLSAAPYQYSFNSSQLGPLSPPRWTPPKSHPLTRVPLASNIPTPSPSAHFAGKLTLTPALKSRLPVPPTLPSAPTRQLLQPATFLIGVRADGSVAFLMLQSSSGDGRADLETEAFLRQLRFENHETALEWGHATLLWATPPAQ
jgi:hypothetical protein